MGGSSTRTGSIVSPAGKSCDACCVLRVRDRVWVLLKFKFGSGVEYSFPLPLSRGILNLQNDNRLPPPDSRLRRCLHFF